ncbi:uracil-DNA glycosylase [Halobacillus yeomjeoni]|uniref:Uracil-DNA glycosylase n=1 Tax=Halobacillus yeomjeoni TaxID=311194 RepID=A0A931HTR0_9BACI|nr:uracil-DNA glycosylase [Halobacillus yeomjeoni]MBH0229507.1 uracil-DNA glycosylase [Halobacillus yeomjeoni]
MKSFNNDWAYLLHAEFEKSYYQTLREKLKEEYQTYSIYPDMNNIFAALDHTSYQNTKVVILGQDPYHGPEQAHGFSFSVKPDVKIPPSLRNIFKEMEADLGLRPPDHGHLVSWAEQGVLLLNNVLTVRAYEAHSHQGLGWEKFTHRVIELLNQRKVPVVFILWGRHAQKKGSAIDRSRHKVITSPHPSPLSAHRGFFGSRPFSKANEFLESIGEEPVNWELPEKIDL